MDLGQASKPIQRGRGLTWVVAALWGLIVPVVCVLTGGAVVFQSARTAALHTAAVRAQASVPATATEAVAAPLSGEPFAPAVSVTEVPATGTATGTVTSIPLPPRTATSTPTPTPTRVPSATRTETAEVAPLPDGELVIGHSAAGRPLTVTQFGSGPVVRLIVAGIHGGNEWNTIALAEALVENLRAHPETVPSDVTLYVLTALNPDGAARGTDIYARANENNVDLNRNWPSRWQADWSRDGCWKYLRLSGGTHGGSEPETQALMQFMLDYEVEAVISYHSAALGIFAGGQPPDEASLRLAEAVAEASDYPYPPLDFGCVYSGQLIDWASEQGIAALDIELTNHRDIDLEQNLRILEVFLNWQR